LARQALHGSQDGRHTMAIFGRSKKGKQTTSSEHLAYPYPSQGNLQGQYSNAPQQNWSNNLQKPNPSQVYGSQNFQGSAIYLPPQPQQINITQNLFLAPPLPERPKKSGNTISKLNLSSVNNLLEQGLVTSTNYVNTGVQAGANYLNQEAALCTLISSKFDTIITLIDGDKFSGDERELAVYQAPRPIWQQEQEPGTTDRGLMKSGKSKGMVNNSISSALTSANYFAKVNLYANSRLPPNLPPLKL